MLTEKLRKHAVDAYELLLTGLSNSLAGKESVLRRKRRRGMKFRAGYHRVHC